MTVELYSGCRTRCSDAEVNADAENGAGADRTACHRPSEPDGDSASGDDALSAYAANGSRGVELIVVSCEAGG